MKNDDPLDELLLKWQVQTPAPAGFRREVWGRIAAGTRPAPSWADRMAEWIFRPATLTACPTLALLGGGLMAWAARPPVQQDVAAREVYLRSIDPFHPGHLVASK